MLMVVNSSNGQQLVSGKVIHAETGQPLPGVNILVENTTIGTVTGTDGAYSLSLPAGFRRLIFSHMGMITREISPGEDEASLDIAMEPDLLMMEGVVITAIGIPREQKALGYSVQELPGAVFRQVHHDNFINSLSGRLAGVNIVGSSGSAGASSYINIRGATSIDGNNQPLFVVDGIPVSNYAGYQVVNGVDMSNRAMDLNPDDFAAVSVLKGGAATALYGLRAANGAIVITTKKGKHTPGDKISASFRTALSFERASRLPPLQDRYGQGIFGSWGSGMPVSWGPRLDTCSYSVQPEDWQFPRYDADGAVVGMNHPNATGEPARSYDPYEFLQTALSQQYAIDLSGGSEAASFITSASYNRSEGIIPGNLWKRVTFRLAGDASLSASFKIFGSANYIHSGGQRMQKGSNTSAVMLGLLRTPASFNNAAGYELPDGSQRNYRHGSGYDNPYWSVEKNQFTDDVDRLIGYAGFNWFITRWLTLDYRIGIDYFTEDWKNYFAKGSAENPDGSVWLRDYQQRDINSDLMLRAEHKFGEKWTTSLMLGHHLFETYAHELSGTANGLALPGFYHLVNASDIAATEYITRVRRAAYFGILEADYDRMIFLTLTGRNEWSTTLPANANSFFYPSASVSWIFTELEPLNRLSFLSYGKLRFSYAQTASDALPYLTRTGFTSYPVTDRYSTRLNFPLLGQTGFTLSNTLGSEDLRPEKTNTWEIGTDLRWFGNRLGIDFTWFSRKSQDILLQVQVSGTAGYYTRYMNAGEMTSEGIELALGLKPVSSTAWSWDAFFSFTRINNEVTRLAPGIDAIALGYVGSILAAREGYPYQSFFGYDWKRDKEGNVLIDDDPGSPSYGFPMGDYDSLVYEGKFNPDWILGWSNSISWKNLSFSFLLDLKVGGKVFNGTRGSLYYFGSHADQESREPDDLVVFEGVKQSDGSPNDIEVVMGANWYFFGEGSTFTGPDAPYIEDAGWLRLREITLSYRLEREQLGNSRIGLLNLFITGRNLLLFTPYSGIDPETSLFGSSNVQGFDYYNMPGTKGITIGLEMMF